MGDRLTAEELNRPGAMLGHKVVVKEVTGSTNDDGRQLAEEGAPHGVVVIAEVQEKGRGRRGRSWSSPPGVNLLFSVLLRDKRLTQNVGLIPLAAGCAVARAVEALTAIPAHIKWPNDVRVKGRKLAGILAESGGRGGIEWIVLGVGVNVNLDPADLPAELRSSATSLKGETGREWRRAELFLAILSELEVFVKDVAAGGEEVRREWEKRDEIRGCRVVVESPEGKMVGWAVGLHPDGALLLRGEDGRQWPVLAGDVFRIEN